MRAPIKNGWRPFKLDELGFVGRGRSRHRPRNEPTLYGGPYPFFQTGEIKAAELYLRKSEQTYSEKGLTQSKLWEPGTLCITIAANIADTAILGVRGCFPDSVVGFVADEKKSDVRFVKYCFDVLQRRMQSVSHGTTQDNFSLEKMLKFDFLVPPLATQQKIAAVLGAYDELIENNRRRIEILEEMARRLYREWFVQFRFPGHTHVPLTDSPLGKIPKGWEVVKLNGLGTVERGRSRHRPRNDPSLYGGPYPFIQTGDIKAATVFATQYSQTYNDHGLAQSRLWEPGVLCITIAANIAETAILGIRGCFPDSVVGFTPNKKKTNVFFVKHFIDSIKERMQAASLGTTQDNLSVEKLLSFDCLSPPLPLCERYEKIISPIYDLLLNLEQRNANLQKTRDLLLPRLISGELDVSELPIEVEEAAHDGE